MARRSRPKSPDFSPKKFGTNLKAIRRGQGLSQPELAEVSRISTQVVSNLERGTATPSIDTICKMARGLGVEPIELINAGLSNQRRPPSRVAKLINLMATFDEKLAEQAFTVLKALSQVRQK